jgi:pimeloyl-ACP methyl ester carboxylesterase
MRGIRAALTCLALAAGPLAALDGDRAGKGLEGAWQGTLKVGVDLRIVLKFVKEGAGWKATLDSPDEGLLNLPLSKVEVKGDEVRLELKRTGAVVEARLNASHTELAGEWKQRGKAFPIVFRWTDRPATLNRPQAPKKPYPYDEQEVVFENKKASVKLAGTLTLPKGKGRVPAVLLVSGSGPQDRDESILGHKPFLVLADSLTRRGIAVLRYDDRGVGKSTGDHAKATTADFADDARAGIAFLKGHDRIDPERVGLIGHSEGGIIGAMLGASKEVSFLVLLAGSALPGAEVLYGQGQALVKAMGGDKEQQRQQGVFHKLGIAAIRKHEDNKKALQEFREGMSAELEKAGLKGEKAEAALKVLDGEFAKLSSPWFRQFLAHDPRPNLRKVSCPVLALIGEKDLQILPADNIPELKKAFAEGKNRDATVKEVAGVNHLFQTCKTGLVSEYVRIEETFAPSALDLIGEWVVARTRAADRK